MNNKYLLTENELEHQLIQCCIQGNIHPCFIFAPCVPFDIVCKFKTGQIEKAEPFESEAG